MRSVIWNRRLLLKGGLSLVAFSILAGCSALPLAQQSPASKIAKMPRIGYLTNTRGHGPSEFQQGLRDLGYIDNQNINVEFRNGDLPDELARYAAELIDLPVDIIVVADTASTRAAQQATATIPVVMLTSADPIGHGFIKSLARPGGNITGLTQNRTQLSGKRLELLNQVAGPPSRVTVLWDPSDPDSLGEWHETKDAAAKLGIRLDSLESQRADFIAPALQASASGGANALLVLLSLVMDRQVMVIIHLTKDLRLPAMFDDQDWVHWGGLMSYGPNALAQHRRAATYVAKILIGARPADLPVEQPTVFDFVVNLGTARAIGLTIPQSVLELATELIQ